MDALRRLGSFVEDRIGIKGILHLALHEPVPGGARLRYVFGSVLTFLFMQQVVLGILLASYYSPSATDAWASTAYIQDRVTAGWFLRGLHHHGSSAMVVLVVLHMAQVIIAGAYKAPREFNWWTGLLMGGLVLAFALTGYLLPWDQKGYWATKVATGIMGTIPAGGELQQEFVTGGTDYGNLTLTRFYAMHVFVLPGLLGALLVLHIWLFRRHGVTPPASMSPEQLEKKRGWFWPDQLFLDVMAMAFTGALLVWLTYQTHGAELYAPADPSSNFVARPEWYFLFLFQLLKYFQGPLQIIATVIIPGAATVFLFALPFVDRSKSRRVRTRGGVLSMVGIGMAGVVALTAMAMVEDAKNEKFLEGQEFAEQRATQARELAVVGVLPQGGPAVWKNDPRYEVIELFTEHCKTCHSLDGAVLIGGEEAPDLSEFRTRIWLEGAIREPRSAQYFGGTKAHEDMEAYTAEDLPDEQLNAVVEYLMQLRGDPSDTIDAALAQKGKTLWDDELECNGCHEVEKGAGGGSPNFFQRGSLEWIKRVILDSSGPDLYEDAAEMPKFEGKLTDEQVEQLAQLIYGQDAQNEDDEE